MTDTFDESFESPEFAVVKSQRQPGMLPSLTPDPEDPPGTVAIPVVVPHPSGKYVVARMRVHEKLGEPKFSTDITNTLFETMDDAVEYVLEEFDEP